MEEFVIDISKESINEKPLKSFEGRIEVIEDEKSAKNAIKKLKTAKILGFDTESRPSFRKGEHHPVSLIQFSDENCAYLFRINKLENVSYLKDILGSKKIIKVGLGLTRDITELYDELQIKSNRFVDLESIARTLKFKQRGVRALSAYFMGIRISKSAQKSNWERNKLTEQQVRYAATDAWVCLEILNKMIKNNLVDLKNKGLYQNYLKSENQ